MGCARIDTRYDAVHLFPQGPVPSRPIREGAAWERPEHPMPFKSKAQRRYMHSQHPEIAERWEKETPKGKRLPEKKKPAKKKK